MRHYKRGNTLGRAIFYVVSVIIIIVLFGVYILIPEETSQLPIIAFIISVVASVLASLIYAFISESYLYTKRDEVIESLDDEVERLESVAKVIEDINTNRILRIVPRDKLEESFWTDFIRLANDQLILSGKTLNRWISKPERKDNFTLNLLKALSNGVSVAMIMYKTDSLDKVDLEERKSVKTYLNDYIFNQITAKEGNEYVIKKGINITIKETESLPYFFITNGVCSVAMPYFSKVSNNQNLALILPCSNSLSNDLYMEDFKSIVTNADDNNWIKEYLDIKNNPKP